MEWVKFKAAEHDSYIYRGSSSISMDILGRFLYCDVRCSEISFFKRWALADKTDPRSQFTYSIGGNATFLEEEDDGYIYLFDRTESFSPKLLSQYLKISRSQFVQLLDEWQEKFCKEKPKEVIIKHENDQFFIETNN